CLILIPFWAAYGQETRIELGKSVVPVDEYFTISVTLKDQQLKSIGKFPDLERFEKSNRFSSTRTSTLNGQVSATEQTITQNYAALKEGEFTIKPFSIELNGKTVESKGGNVKVVAAGGQSSVPETDADLFEELFGNRQPREFIDK